MACSGGASGAGSREVPIKELQDRLLTANVILDPASAMQGLPFDHIKGEAGDDWWK